MVNDWGSATAGRRGCPEGPVVIDTKKKKKQGLSLFLDCRLVGKCAAVHFKKQTNRGKKHKKKTKAYKKTIEKKRKTRQTK